MVHGPEESPGMMIAAESQCASSVLSSGVIPEHKWMQIRLLFRYHDIQLGHMPWLCHNS